MNEPNASSSLEDRQLVQIVVDEVNNGAEFEFNNEMLARDFVIKGYSFWSSCDLNQWYFYTRGHFAIEIDWLKVDGISKTTTGINKQSQKIMLPFNMGEAYVGGAAKHIATSNLSMDYRITLPSQTSMRKRFKVRVLYDQPAVGEVEFQNLQGGAFFRLVLHLEVTHNHTFK